MRKVMQKRFFNIFILSKYKIYLFIFRFFSVKEGKLYFYRSKALFDEDNSHKTISLLTTTVKHNKNALCFDLVTLTKTFTFQADTAEGNPSLSSSTPLFPSPPPPPSPPPLPRLNISVLIDHSELADWVRALQDSLVALLNSGVSPSHTILFLLPSPSLPQGPEKIFIKKCFLLV
jgi:hypothetical protein